MTSPPHHFSYSEYSTHPNSAMDVFGTTITAGGMILDFVGACAAYSEEAASLKARFEWDLHALKAVQDYFEQRKAQNENQQLSSEDAALLERTAGYLDNLVSKVQRSLHKIQRKGLLNNVVNRGMWITRQADLKEMEAEVYEWTRRFDVRVLGLPQKLRASIPSSVELEPPSIIRSHDRLRHFLDLTSNIKKKQVKMKRLENSEQLAAKITARGDACFLPMQEGDRQLIFASRSVSPLIISAPPIFNKLEFEMGMLAAALSCFDWDTGIRLLRVESYFYHRDLKQFIFIHVSPFPVVSTMNLEDAIKQDCFPNTEATLHGRFTLALKLAEAVFFLHTAGFVHKNITSSSVVALQRLGSASTSLDDCYLMGFDLIRGVDGKTSKEGAVINNNEEGRSIWEFDIFQHPDRLSGKDSLRYTKTYDVYSLGVVLLEIGSWEPLIEIATGLNENDRSHWTVELLEAASILGPKTGGRYQRLVAWCLGVDGSEVVTEGMFVEHVLDPLEEIVNALS
ncbi:hypothetical protein F4860DRAFT_484886 [Xylaria cubensis]|nr:hypothetical protein F4860DRAFT_484886 [Xylaria cubensis]